MSPFDPESSTQAGEWTIRTAYEHGVGYLVPAVIGWLASRLRIAKRVEDSARTTSKQIDQLGVDLRKELTAMKGEIMERLEEVERRQQSLGQEMWGAHGHGGVAAHLEAMERRIEGISRSTSAIEAQLKTLAPK